MIIIILNQAINKKIVLPKKCIFHYLTIHLGKLHLPVRIPITVSLKLFRILMYTYSLMQLIYIRCASML